MKPKNVISLLIAVALGAIPAVSMAQHSGHGTTHRNKAVTMNGEIIDLQCYMQHPENAVGMEHAKCAQACMAKGLPIGFLSDDGSVFVLVSAEHDPVVNQVKDWAGKKCALTGTVIERKGMKGIEFASIAAAGDANPAVWYTCSMHPDVRQHEPGNCSKCGMTLEAKK